MTEEMQRHYSTVGLDEKRAAIAGVLRDVDHGASSGSPGHARPNSSPPTSKRYSAMRAWCSPYSGWRARMFSSVIERAIADISAAALVRWSDVIRR